MSLLWGIARKLLGLQCPSFAQRYPYILSWEWLWSFGWPHSTAKICQEVPPLSNKMIKICNSSYAQKSLYWNLTFLGLIIHQLCNSFPTLLFWVFYHIIVGQLSRLLVDPHPHSPSNPQIIFFWFLKMSPIWNQQLTEN